MRNGSHTDLSATSRLELHASTLPCPSFTNFSTASGTTSYTKNLVFRSDFFNRFRAIGSPIRPRPIQPMVFGSCEDAIVSGK